MAHPQPAHPSSNRRQSYKVPSTADRMRESNACGQGPSIQISNGFPHRSSAAIGPKSIEDGPMRRHSDISGVRPRPTPLPKGLNGDEGGYCGHEKMPQAATRKSAPTSNTSAVSTTSISRNYALPTSDSVHVAVRPLPMAGRQPYNIRSRPAGPAEVVSSRPASGLDIERNVKISTVFDLFIDLPHPAASKNSAPAYMIEPPEFYSQPILAEMYEPALISRLARYAFPEHSDHKHTMNVRTKPVLHKLGKGLEGRDKSNHLNNLDIYVLGYRSSHHTFALDLSDGITKLHGHVLRYLPVHYEAKTRADVGRRGVRAMIILTRASGGDKFYTAILKSIEAAVLHGNSLAEAGDVEDCGREKAMRLLHGLYRRHYKKILKATFLLTKAGKGGPPLDSEDLDDTYLTMPAVEYDVKPGAYIQDRSLLGDFIKLQLPSSLQAGFQMRITPDNIDAPVLPLLRSLGPENTLRLISAMMCERKIILVSEDADHLSTCVRGASSLLAQGHLEWQYNLTPVLPPHMLSCLKVKKPYLIGLLDDHVDDLESLWNLTDVLCIHLDRNLIRIFGMANPAKMIPDIMSKDSQHSGTGVLLNDMEQILKAEKRIWGESEVKPSEKENAVSAVPTELKLAKKKKGKGDLGRIETDIALLFGKVMRGDVLGQDDDTVESSIDELNEHARLDRTSGHMPRTIKRSSHDNRKLTIFDICENERGEEGLRAALAFFFLVTHGDLGTMLTEHKGGFLLDRKKFLLTKKLAGIKEDCPMFAFYREFSGTAMLQQHLGQRIEDFERGGSLVLPRHRSLFSLCERHLRTKKVEFAFPNIRKLISTTTLHTPIHAIVEQSEIARARALTLTSAQPIDGDIYTALSSLMHDCHHCDITLPQTIAVVWSRLDDRRPNGWKHPLLGLHLLKNILLHGPITAISYAMDGTDKVRRLRFYSMAKSSENNKEVQDSAQFVWSLMMDRPRLLLRRQQVVSGRAKLKEIPQGIQWQNYLIKKVPFNTPFREYHTLLRPKETVTPSFMKQGRTQVGGQDLCRMEILKMKFSH